MNFLANKIFTLLENRINLDQNLITLKRKLEELNAVKEDNESKKCVELQPRKKLKKEMEIWFQHIERINGEILKDLESEAGGSNLLSRGFLGSNISKRVQEVEELLQRGKSFSGLVIDKPQRIGQILPTTTLIGEYAKSFMEKIWAYLMNDGVWKIGVWGLGGVGKTTIMKLINNKLLEETENAVLWVTVSKELNIAKLQNDIARAMNVSLSEADDVTRRAGMLHEMLSGKGKYVLILDDVWDNLSLEEVGIPEPTVGSKLVVTTRKLDVCRYLDCREFKVPTLPKQDAMSLFLRKVGRDVLNNPDLSPIMESVVEQCAHLPLAIVIVASSMKGISNVHEWRNALNELSSRVESVTGLDEKLFQQLQFSYDRLENELVKRCFLCCALYPEDCDIIKTELIELWINEGLVQEINGRKQSLLKGIPY